MFMRIDMKKIFYIFTIYFAIVLLQGCFLSFCDCDKPPFPYLDIESIKVNTAFKDATNSSKELFFYINPDSISLIAFQKMNCKSIFLISKAEACSCQENGYKGAKIKLKKINIYADSVFSSNIPNEEPINQLLDRVVTVSQGGGVFVDEYTPLIELSNSDFSLLYKSYSVQLRLKHKPISNRPYKFRIEMIKENNEKLVKETDFIVWE